MLNYLEKFHNLPADLQDGVSTPEVMQAIADIEAKYDISLAAVVMKVMVRDISLVDLPKLLVFEFSLEGQTARDIVEELRDRVFGNVADYLGIPKKGGIDIEKDVNLDSWMEQKQSEAGIRSSTFFFSPEDEEEIKNLTVKLADPAVLPTDNTVINEAIARILPALGVNFSSVEMTERLKKILYTYLRGVRSKIDTKQTLMKPVGSGGMELDTFLSDKILTITDKITSAPAAAPASPAVPPLMEAPPAVAQPEKKPKDVDELIARMKQAGVRDADYDFSKLAAVKPAAPDSSVSAGIKDKDIVLGEISKQAGVNQNNEPLPIAAPPVPAPVPVKNEPGAMAAPALNLASRRLFAGRENKHKIADVKFVPKLVGPIDELGEMDLVNFRRLNNDPRVSAATIKEKISFLEEDSYGQRLAGIKAWRQSPLNKLYIDIGHDSISKKVGIDEVISARKEVAQEYLTPEEFYAIMDLNKTLRF